MFLNALVRQAQTNEVAQICNPWYIEFIWGNIKIYFFLISSINSAMSCVIKILPRGRQEHTISDKNVYNEQYMKHCVDTYKTLHDKIHG